MDYGYHDIRRDVEYYIPARDINIMYVTLSTGKTLTVLNQKTK